MDHPERPSVCFPSGPDGTPVVPLSTAATSMTQLTTAFHSPFFFSTPTCWDHLPINRTQPDPEILTLEELKLRPRTFAPFKNFYHGVPKLIFS